ncbi:hypothetical protein EYF80_001821 [Liparis tanakae]|uniref:Uncharacterized protein n=1 Tax=Liparis tanakae TaxID=230148 RepID=A0A4Z2JCX4_9TELE|nr:hypothetical protein EYF80_001821 [Liparis tanakae]
MLQGHVSARMSYTRDGTEEHCDPGTTTSRGLPRGTKEENTERTLSPLFPQRERGGGGEREASSETLMFTEWSLNAPCRSHQHVNAPRWSSPVVRWFSPARRLPPAAELPPGSPLRSPGAERPPPGPRAAGRWAAARRAIAHTHQSSSRMIDISITRWSLAARGSGLIGNVHPT